MELEKVYRVPWENAGLDNVKQVLLLQYFSEPLICQYGLKLASRMIKSWQDLPDLLEQGNLYSWHGFWI